MLDEIHRDLQEDRKPYIGQEGNWALKDEIKAIDDEIRDVMSEQAKAGCHG